MEGVLIFIISYAIIIIVWLIFATLLFALSLIFKKNLSAIPVGITYILGFIIQLGLVIYAISILWQIISHGEWLILILALIFGSFIIGWWQFIYSLLLMPFSVSASYFLSKIDDTDFKDETLSGEVLDEKGKVIGVSESETSLKTRFAKYFLAVYLLDLIPLIIFPVEREGMAPLDYITKPFFQIIGLTLIIGIPYAIYRKIKYKTLLTKDKRYFLIQTWKISLYIFIPFSIIVYTLAILTNTL